MPNIRDFKLPVDFVPYISVSIEYISTKLTERFILDIV